MKYSVLSPTHTLNTTGRWAVFQYPSDKSLATGGMWHSDWNTEGEAKYAAAAARLESY